MGKKAQQSKRKKQACDGCGMKTDVKTVSKGRTTRRECYFCRTYGTEETLASIKRVEESMRKRVHG